MRRLSRETGAQPECASLCRTLCTGLTCILLYTSAVLTDNLPSYQDFVLFWRWVWECGLFESPAKIRHIAHSYSFIIHLSRFWEETVTRVWFHVQTQDMYQQFCDYLFYNFNFNIFSPHLPLIHHFTHLHTVHKAVSLWCQVTMPFREWLMYKNINRLFRKIYPIQKIHMM